MEHFRATTFGERFAEIYDETPGWRWVSPSGQAIVLRTNRSVTIRGVMPCP
jgi:hypothetical protein